MKKYMAGYTGITNIGGNYYLGTDFSSRPNYIETLNGKKFKFPGNLFKMWVLAFRQYQDRYLLSINVSMLERRRAVSIFDTETKKFIFCDYLDSIQTDDGNKLPQWRPLPSVEEIMRRSD